MTAAILTRALSKRYGTTMALDSLDLTVAPRSSSGQWSRWSWPRGGIA
jgi:hypothetical protein